MMCDYCDGSEKPIVEIDGGVAYMTLAPDDSEYPEGFLLNFYSEPNERGIWYSFIVSCCPMCGRELRGDAE